MKTEHSAMHNHLNCWPTNSPIKSSTNTSTYNQPIQTGNNQTNQVNQVNQTNQVNPINQLNPINQINQINPINPINPINQLVQINHHSPRGSFSSDQSTNNIASDYSFNSSSNSNNSNLSNNLVTSTMNNLHLVDQIQMPIATSAAQPIVQTQQYSTIKASIQSQVNQSSIRNSNLPRCFNDLPTPGLDKNRVTKKKGKQNAYKHVPHREKPPHLVAKRNCRERKRVEQLNEAFGKLRKNIPIENKNKRVSKVKTLQKAIDYIRDLERMLNDFDSDCPNSTLKLRSNFSFASLVDGDEPTSTTELDFRLDDDTDNSQSIFENDFLDETSQQSNNQTNVIESINQYTNPISYQPAANAQQAVELHQPADTNNNLLNSNAIHNQLINQHLAINSFSTGDQNAYSNRNQIPIHNLVNKENILYQNVTNDCNVIYNNVSYVNYNS